MIFPPFMRSSVYVQERFATELPTS